jgi:hypothetical protein
MNADTILVYWYHYCRERGGSVSGGSQLVGRWNGSCSRHSCGWSKFSFLGVGCGDAGRGNSRSRSSIIGYLHIAPAVVVD